MKLNAHLSPVAAMLRCSGFLVSHESRDKEQPVSASLDRAEGASSFNPAFLLSNFQSNLLV